MTYYSYVIPITNAPETFKIALGVTNYILTVYWNNSVDAGWTLDIADENNNYLVQNLPLVTGTNLLSGLEYLGITGSLYVSTNGNEFAVPTYENIGIDSQLYFISTVPTSG